MGVEQRPAHLPRHREIRSKGPSHFATFVPFETIQGALFNYWEPSLGLDTNGKSHATVFLSQIDNWSSPEEGGLNIVVIEDLRRSEGRTRVDWYFGTFKGKPRGETRGEETVVFDRSVEHIRSRHHRVAGSELNALIRNAAGMEQDATQETAERGRLYGIIKDGIATYVQEGGHQDQTERDCYFDSESSFRTNYHYDDIPDSASLTINFRWVDEDPYSAAEADMRVKYKVESGSVVKDGYYDYGRIDGQHPVKFLANALKNVHDPYGGSLAGPDLFPSPEVSLSELRLLAKIVGDPGAALPLIKKLPPPASWPKN